MMPVRFYMIISIVYFYVDIVVKNLFKFCLTICNFEIHDENVLELNCKNSAILINMLCRIGHYLNIKEEQFKPRVKYLSIYKTMFFAPVDRHSGLFITVCLQFKQQLCWIINYISVLTTVAARKYGGPVSSHVLGAPLDSPIVRYWMDPHSIKTLILIWLPKYPFVFQARMNSLEKYWI